MKKKMLCLIAALFCALICGAAPAVEEKGGAIILRNAGAEYKFQKGKFYHLLESRYKGRPFWVKGFGLTYNMPGDKWYWEDKPFEFYKMAPRTHKIIRKGDALTLATRGDGANMSLIRNFTLRGDSPALEVQVRLEVRNRNNINWLNLFSTSFPVTNEFWTLISRVKEGRIVTAMEKVEHPFVDPATKKFYVLGNYVVSQYAKEFFVCSYDAKKDVGAVMMQMPEFSRLPLRVGMAQAKSPTVYCNVSPYFFNGTEKESFLDARYKVLPFTGDPGQLNKDVIPEFVAKMRNLYALPKSYDTGIALKSGSGIALWADLSSQKVYPSAPAPAKAVENKKAAPEKRLNFSPQKARGKASILLSEVPKTPSSPGNCPRCPSRSKRSPFS